MSPDELAWAKAEFDRCQNWLQAALDKSLGEYALEHVWEFIASGRAQIWPMPDACIVTLVEDYPTGKRFLKHWLAGGDLTEIQQAEPTIRAWAVKAKCDKIVIGGRRGWLRAFSDYREQYTVIARNPQ